MKKVLYLLVALLLIGSIALAEAIDLSTMTDDELLNLHNDVKQAIKERGISIETHLPSGVYVVGSDIKAGKYVIRTGADQGNGNLYVYENKEKLDTDETIFYQYMYSQTEQEFFVSLEESNVLVLKMEGYAMIRKADMIG